jgi:putative PIN family toxin of toxin-antitoxin system
MSISASQDPPKDRLVPRIRALFDTNIFISYLLPSKAGGAIEQILEAAFDEAFTLLIAEEVVQEFSAKVASKSYLRERISKEAADELMAAVLVVAEVIPGISNGTGALSVSGFPVVTRDAKDDYLLAYALLGRADYLVTGDDDLLVLGEIEGVKIVPPAEFRGILGL